LKYNQLPDYLLAFDIYDKDKGYFLSTAKIKKVLNNKIFTVPIIWQGKSKDLPDFRKLIKKTNYGSEIIEGIYIRVEDSQRVIKRYKYRRNTFEPGREDFYKKNKKNQLK
ncbi:MAG: RNA ligase family protein, partial [Candidatus Cloacimonetes bacterium]|nr:RNA ligase family protein [Candidatus Cloacimonadota bacterium]